MPFAGFDTFDDCVQKFVNQGDDVETAKKKCGALQAKIEGSSTILNVSSINNNMSFPPEKKPEGEGNGQEITLNEQDAQVVVQALVDVEGDPGAAPETKQEAAAALEILQKDVEIAEEEAPVA